MNYSDILEYPYHGTITRVIAGTGRNPDIEILVYEGVMDEHMVTDEEGSTMQTSSYIISIPLTKKQSDESDDGSNDGEESEPEWVIPHKGDKISITRYGETFTLIVDNAEPSQLGGISIYAARNSWY